jgi:hypothetical protein
MYISKFIFLVHKYFYQLKIIGGCSIVPDNPIKFFSTKKVLLYAHVL